MSDSKSLLDELAAEAAKIENSAGNKLAGEAAAQPIHDRRAAIIAEAEAEAEAARERDEQERAGLPDTVEADKDDEPKWKPFNIDGYLDAVLGAKDTKAAQKAADKFLKTAPESYDPKGSLAVYQGVDIRLRRGVPAQVAFAPTVRIGDQSELAILINKETRAVFNAAVADDDRFLLSGSFEVDDPGVQAWINMKEVLQILAMQADTSGKD